MASAWGTSSTFRGDSTSKGMSKPSSTGSMRMFVPRQLTSAPGATILEGFHVNGSSVDGAAEDVAAWLSGLGL